MRHEGRRSHPGKARVQLLKALLPQFDAVIDKRLRILNGVLIFNNSYELQAMIRPSRKPLLLNQGFNIKPFPAWCGTTHVAKSCCLVVF